MHAGLVSLKNLCEKPTISNHYWIQRNGKIQKHGQAGGTQKLIEKTQPSFQIDAIHI
jgi:hypothetical protein